nr:MAG TPA: hypothetical protein [Caudoviricetes sp.]
MLHDVSVHSYQQDRIIIKINIGSIADQKGITILAGQ